AALRTARRRTALRATLRRTALRATLRRTALRATLRRTALRATLRRTALRTALLALRRRRAITGSPLHRPGPSLRSSRGDGSSHGSSRSVYHRQPAREASPRNGSDSARDRCIRDCDVGAFAVRCSLYARGNGYASAIGVHAPSC